MSLPNINSSTMMDSMKYQNMVKEEGEDEEVTEKWSEKYKKSIDCSHPKGFSQRAHCQGRKKHMKEDECDDCEKPKKVEATEATGAASAGQYSGPMFLAKNSKNWRGGKKPIYKGGKFVRVKKKCKKFPYCNQGDINAIEQIKEAIESVSNKTGVPKKEIEEIVLNEIKQIFI